jgi:hypothetical protein
MTKQHRLHAFVTIFVVGFTMVPAGVDAAEVSRANSLAQTLIDGAPRHVPKGYSSAKASRVVLNDDDRRSGMVAGVQVALEGGDPKGSIRYGFFHSEKEANAFLSDLSGRLPRESSPKFLPYLTSANCVDTPSGGLCSLLVVDVVIVARASQVDRGASLVLMAAKEAVEAARMTASPSSGSSAGATAPKSATTGARDGCALLTKPDAEAALGGPVADLRRSGDSCYYGSKTVAGDGVTLQLIEGGRSKFDFDRGRMQRTVGISGIGDDAFAFVSQAGFVQLYVIKGSGYAAITLQNSRDGNRLESAKTLARKIAARL